VIGAGGRSAPRSAAATVAVLASCAVFWLYRSWLLDPFLRYDDFNFLTKSRTWPEFWTNVWLPMNDHAMPLSRFSAAVLMQAAQTPSAIPHLAALQCVLAVIGGMWLIYRFVSRELQHQVYGLLALIAWGVTGAYYECVTWYSASFFVLSLDAMMLGLVAAQQWQATRRAVWAAACTTCCALAPGWYAGGALAGPVCALYVLTEPRVPTEPPAAMRLVRSRALRALIPMIGTVAFFAVSLPRTAESIVHAEHYRGKTVFQAFDPIAGTENTLRTLADNQIIGAFGIYRSSAFDWPVVLAIDAVLVGLAVLWWRIANSRRLIVVGLAVMLTSDLLIYSARADWDYVRQVHRWTRYHLFPHLGLVLVFAGGLPVLGQRLFHPLATGRLSYRQVIGLVMLIGGLSFIHTPRTAGSHMHIAEVTELMQRMDRVEATCRRVRISSEIARQALGFQQMPLGYRGDNAWELLRCSANPRPISIQDAVIVLNAAEHPGQ
jgi:hypothetical protein